MANYTLTYTKQGIDGSGGWPSFYSFYPDWMVGMNNYFYSFKGGGLYRHNTGEKRNNFYGDQYISTLKTVFNEQPLSNKLWKAFAIEGTNEWRVEFVSDQQLGYIEAEWFKKKEGAYFGFVRNYDPTIDYDLRSVNGIAECESATFDAVSNTVTLVFGDAVEVGSIISVGDVALIGDSPDVGGVVTTISGGTIVYQVAVGGVVATDGDFIMYAKNGIAESHGVLGHYNVVTMTNSEDTAIELFVVRSEVMKSYP